MELASLIGRLNPDNRRALERAAQRCLQRGHHYVEIEHLLLELLDIEGVTSPGCCRVLAWSATP